MGYLINQYDDILDVFSGNILFKKEHLEQAFNQESEIPLVFRDNKLMEAERDPQIRWLENRNERAKRKRANKEQHKPSFGPGYQAADTEESEESDFDMENDLKKVEARQQ